MFIGHNDKCDIQEGFVFYYLQAIKAVVIVANAITLITLWANSADDKLMIFFLQKTDFGIP